MSTKLGRRAPRFCFRRWFTPSKANKRSMNSEIVARLEWSLDRTDGMVVGMLAEGPPMIEGLDNATRDHLEALIKALMKVDPKGAK